MWANVYLVLVSKKYILPYLIKKKKMFTEHQMFTVFCLSLIHSDIKKVLKYFSDL